MIAFAAVLAGVAVLAGGVAALSGFGIGSLLTPVLAYAYDTRLAVAAVAIPHAVGTALRAWRLRHALDRRVLRGFGLASAAGGLAGALLHGRLGSPALTLIFGALLVLAGLSGFLPLWRTLRPTGAGSLALGALSGLFGGLVGNQGGIRSAALLGFSLEPQAFVATATVTALLVDAARLPVYLLESGARLRLLAPVILLATLGVVVGTLAGARLLARIPAPLFRRLVAGLILLLGVAILAEAALGGRL
ncbi:MAG TPA: sulfite exporter TauE/SafE family protein [Gemmatimonadales bacterium]|nr:sulfite exporter TauE/SafE family protein [Gemmatimonadales bacterium]